MVKSRVALVCAILALSSLRPSLANDFDCVQASREGTAFVASYKSGRQIAVSRISESVVEKTSKLKNNSIVTQRYLGGLIPIDGGATAKSDVFKLQTSFEYGPESKAISTLAPNSEWSFPVSLKIAAVPIGDTNLAKERAAAANKKLDTPISGQIVVKTGPASQFELGACEIGVLPVEINRTMNAPSKEFTTVKGLFAPRLGIFVRSKSSTVKKSGTETEVLELADIKSLVD